MILLQGDIRMVMRTDDGDVEARLHEPGSYLLVPRGTWHTGRPNVPMTMLFITPGEGTINAEEPEEA